MKYILDSSCLRFMLEGFPKKSCKELWGKFEESCKAGYTKSVDQVLDQLVNVDLSNSETCEWLDENKEIFEQPTNQECVNLARFLENGVFSYYTNQNDIARNLPISTPFVIIKAYSKGDETAVVIDRNAKDGDKILDICKKLNVKCIDYDEYLEAI
jgi:hypothetical protein